MNRLRALFNPTTIFNSKRKLSVQKVGL